MHAAGLHIIVQVSVLFLYFFSQLLVDFLLSIWRFFCTHLDSFTVV